ncbi:sugar transferase [Megasphaera paucivorans]|uniref:Sugar transferase involved in LPS biosynthesis (Colanic, teichoic acid) n=1 Tax=Megasphaera paucivorans TaxID=349095 RepID=A0A1G9W0G4_9FIRM|nr:sugar transferase [Megasphaera paucivorans]SDM78010.1 Sugar transferase involved in LPS biosynthesis (colanic, teichoic acid) [Megasphaera paucivorans]
MYRHCIKRLIDLVLSLMAFAMLSPLLIVIGILVRIKLGKPVFFKQQRPGKDEIIFEIFKFRTMKDTKDRNGNLLSDELRLTRFGGFLRSTSIDELPELINILKGDMSIVGPRPLLVKYLPLYNERQHHRHDVRPGLTGLAQVNGRNAITWEKKFEYDVTYTKNITFMGDCKIIFQTVLKVLQRNGISSKTSATMEEFKRK